MKKIALLAFLLVANQAAAESINTDGPGALALATLVGAQSRTLSGTDRAALLRLLSGSLTRYPAEQMIMVGVDKIDCRTSNVDIIDHSCVLTFGTMTKTIMGREAHELYATLAEAGVRSDAAAGTVHESVSQLTCSIDPNAIKQKDGSGAECKFDTGG
jgi:hypothetical protein